MWRERATGDIVRRHDEIRARREQSVSMPPVLTDEIIDHLGFDPVTPTAVDFDPLTHRADELAPVLIDGQWTQQWAIVVLSPEVSAEKCEAAITAAIAKTYTDVDEVYNLAIGSRGEEYKDAEAAALAYRAAGYTGTASPYVSGWAKSNPTGQVQSDQWAADQIIARADAMRAAKLALRNVRFDRQADMRAATTSAQLRAAVAAWDGFIAAVRGQLGGLAMMRAAFYKGTRPGLQGTYNRVVRVLDGGPYSHSELLFSDGWSASASLIDGGVRFKRIAYDAARWDLIWLPDHDEGFARQWFELNEETRYDLIGQASLIIPIIEPSVDRVWCSEAMAYGLRLENPSSYGPNGLFRELTARPATVPQA